LDLGDPESRYSALSRRVREETTFALPDVRDRVGALIHPKDYVLQIKHGSKVVVEVILKL